MSVDSLRERPADACHAGKVVDRRCLDTAQPAEVREQPLPALRADAGNLVQRRGHARFAAARAVADHGEAMRLVANLLDQVQGGIVRRELQRLRT